jgi:hypothetical protein
MKFLRVSFSAIHFRCSQSVSPGGGATPPTMTSPNLAFGVGGDDVDDLYATHEFVLCEFGAPDPFAPQNAGKTGICRPSGDSWQVGGSHHRNSQGRTRSIRCVTFYPPVSR